MKILEDREVAFVEPLPAWARDGQMAVVPTPGVYAHTVYGRAYTKESGLPVYRSRIFRAMGSDPFRFVMAAEPVVDPQRDLGELACEDPTLIHRKNVGAQKMTIPYLLYSAVYPKKGPDATGVEVGLVAFNTVTLRRTVLLDPKEQAWWERSLDMCKEAEVLPRPDDTSDLLFFEFSDGARSRVGIAGIDLFCRWQSGPLRVDRPGLWMDVRTHSEGSDTWDSDHVSTGPIVTVAEDRHVMFYNGCADKRWSIGTVLFNSAGRILSRSAKPLIQPPDEIGWADQRIAFASGARLQSDGLLLLYYHVADRYVRCAVIDELGTP